MDASAEYEVAIAESSEENKRLKVELADLAEKLIGNC